MFRIVVQDARLTPTSGKFVALLGSYDPHAKVATLDKDKAAFYLSNGAQPSDRAARLFQAEGITLPAWVKLPAAKSGSIRNPEKLRRNQPKKEETTEASSEAAPAEADASAEPAEEKAGAPEA